MSSRLLILFAILATGFPWMLSNAQSVHITEYNVEDGLPFIQVNAITQDAKGYLWIGGYGGLSKFNGHTFKNFSKADGLVGTFIQSLCTDSSGTVWVGTSKGLNTIKNDSINLIEPLSNKTITQIISVDKNILAIANDTLYRIHGNSISKIQLNFTPKHLLYANNSLWVASNNLVYSCSDSFNCQSISAQFNSINNLTIIDGCLVVSHSKGATQLCEDSTKQYNWRTGLLGNSVSNAHQDRNNNFWFATELGLNLLQNNQFKHVTLTNRNGGNEVNEFFCDREGNMWTGSNFGLYKIRASAFKRYGYEDGLSSSFIYQITEDKNGCLWMGTQQSGVYKMDKNSITRFTSTHGLSSDVAKSVCVIGDSILVGTANGVDLIYRNKVSQLTNIPIKGVNNIYQDTKKNIWIGGTGGFCNLKNPIKSFVKLPSNDFHVWNFKESKAGYLLIGTYQGGYYKYKDGVLTNLNKLLQTNFENVLAIEEDQFGNQWYGSFEGLYLYNPSTQKIQLVTEKDGLNSKIIYTLLYDNNEHLLWVGTNQGVNKVELGESGILKITAFNEADGFIGVECNGNGTYQDSDGTLWFGTVNGLIAMNQNGNLTNLTENLTHITRTQLDYSDTTLSNGANLNFNQNNLTFTFMGICLTNPEKVEYRYRLAGFNNKWSPSSTSNQATFSNLNPGKYTFEVVSKNNAGVWNTKPTTFSFTILTPFWKTLWFRVSAITLGILTILSIVLIRIRQIKKQAELNQRVDQLKLQALRAQMNPHFLFNSLNSIQFFINNNNSREANRFLSKFAKLMRLMLDNSRTSAVKLEDEVEALQLYLELEALRFENKFSFSIHVAPNLRTADLEIPPMLVQPFVENAILHAFINVDYPGKISINYLKEENHIVCEIIDNGIGRVAAANEQIKKAKKLHRSSGVNLIAERLNTLNEYYNDKLSVKIEDLYQDSKASGTKVIVHIPIVEHNAN